MAEQREMVRVEIDPTVVEEAKAKYIEFAGLLSIDAAKFRQVVDAAVASHLTTLDCVLAAVGFEELPEGLKPRVWPISTNAAKVMAVVAAARGIPRTAIMRAVLMMAAELGFTEQSQEPAEDSETAEAAAPDPASENGTV